MSTRRVDKDSAGRRQTGAVADNFLRHTTQRGTRLAIQQASDDAAPRLQLVLFDGRPMIEDGVPRALAEARRKGTLPALTAVYVESIEGAAKRGKSRCASLTTAQILDRFAAELREYVDGTPIVLVGHSLGAIAALHVAVSASFTNDVVLLSAALWWPGEDGQLSGRRATDAAVAASGLRIWMTAGEEEDADILQSNDVLAQRLSAVGRPPERHSHPGGHAVRPRDVVDGVRWLSTASAGRTRHTARAARKAR